MAWTHLLDRYPIIVSTLLFLLIGWAIVSTVWLALARL